MSNIQFLKKKNLEGPATAGVGVDSYLTIEQAEVFGADNIDIVLNGEVLDRAGELEMRQERLLADRKLHAEWIEGPQAEVVEETPEAKSALGKILAWLVGTLGRSQQARRGEMITGGSFMASRAVTIDLHGGYQPNVDFEDLPDVDGYWIKAVEVDDTTNPENWRTPRALEYLDRAYRMKKPAYMYVFVNTAYWLRAQVSDTQLTRWDNLPDDERMREYVKNDPQIRTILQQLLVGEEWMSDPSKLRGTKARAWAGIALDMERYWMSYSDWYANGANCAKVGDFWIKRTCSRLYDNLQWLMLRGYIPTLPITYNYTGWWFTSTYSPSLGDWLCDKPVWLAAWYWSAGSVQTTWQGVKDLLAAIPDTWRPKYVYNKLPEVIQISGDRFIIPQIRNSNNVPRTFDVNLHWQTKEEWYAAIGFQAESDPGDDGGNDGDEENPDLAALTQRVVLLEASNEELKQTVAGLNVWRQKMIEANKE